MKAGWDASRTAASPALETTAQTTCPLTTPTAVQTPRRRPPSSVFRIVRAVSCPGVRITVSETPRKAAKCAAPTTYSTVTVFARFRGWSTFRPRSRAIR